jgi:hypothetical protein
MTTGSEFEQASREQRKADVRKLLDGADAEENRGQSEHADRMRKRAREIKAAEATKHP